MRPLVVALATVLATAASAQTVSLSGSLGTSKALLVIDGSPRTVAVGSTVQGVKLINVTAHDAVVEVGGQRATLRLGAAQVSLGGGGGGKATTIVITASSGGHYTSSGAINGKAVQFVVDTGATNVALSEREADRIGLAYRSGRRGMSSTANGMVAVYAVKLASVRVGEVELRDIDATVVPADMPFILLGNSFLSRFQMKSENQVMTLERRF